MDSVNPAEVILTGTELFRNKNYTAAIAEFSKAIDLQPLPINYARRSLCNIHLGNWTEVEADASKMVELDPTSSEGFFLLGVANCETDKLATGIKYLKKAYELEKELDPNGENIKEIWDKFAIANCRKWEHESSERKFKYFNFKQYCAAGLRTLAASENSQITQDELKELLEELDDLFIKAQTHDSPSQIPKHLTCHLTLGLINEPVITPNGNTYEHRAIQDHLDIGKCYDPVSKRALQPTELVPNLALKHVIGEYLDVNPWAFKEFDFTGNSEDKN